MIVDFVLLPRIWPAIAPTTAPVATFCASLLFGWLRTRSTSALATVPRHRIRLAAERHRLHGELHDDLVVHVLAALELRHLERHVGAGGDRRAVRAGHRVRDARRERLADRVGVRADARVGAKASDGPGRDRPHRAAAASPRPSPACCASPCCPTRSSCGSAGSARASASGASASRAGARRRGRARRRRRGRRRLAAGVAGTSFSCGCDRRVAAGHREVAVQRRVARERGVALAVRDRARAQRQRGDERERCAGVADILRHARILRERMQRFVVGAAKLAVMQQLNAVG